MTKSENDGPLVRPLTENVALLTGATAGIGLESAAQLAEAGVAQIVINGRDGDRGQAGAQAIKARAPACDVRFLAADVTDPREASGLVEKAVADFGRIDLLVNCVGPAVLPKIFNQQSEAEIATGIQTGLLATLYVSRAVLPHMTAQKGGAIVNLASDAGKVATPGESVIGAVMAALVMFTRTLAVEAKRDGIRVNCLTPSIVSGTDLYDKLMADPFSSRLFGKAETMAKLGVVTPADLAPLVVYLASPAAARLTGQAISVNGGISAA